MGNTQQKYDPNHSQENQEVELQVTTEADQHFTCEICIEPMLLPNKKFKNLNLCTHPFCNDCMVKYIAAKLEDNVGDIPCPALNCKQFLDPISCRNLVGSQLFVKWCDVLCESAVVGLPQCYCPNRDCSALILDECGNGNVKRSKCPDCKSFFCFKCKVAWHVGFRCEETSEFTDVNDVEFGVLAECNKWKRCPQCRHFVERFEGCRFVTCRCGASFCYKCGRRVYQHWCNCDPAYVFRMYGLSCLTIVLFPIWGPFFLLYLLWDQCRSKR